MRKLFIAIIIFVMGLSPANAKANQASTGRGYSIEKSNWGHSAFTKALLEGLGEAKADYNGNHTISIKEIDLYVTDRVKELTKGRQKPTTIIPDSIPDFALGRWSEKTTLQVSYYSGLSELPQRILFTWYGI